MSFNLELILVLGTLITGLVWVLDVFWWRRRDEKRSREPWYVEYARSFFPVFLIVLLLRSFVVEPFRIPSGSMMPTLLVGDFILVSKFSYGIRLPVVNVKVLNTGEPRRGDVMVFRYPRNPKEDYIKRVVGLPGDRVGYYNKQLYINGERVEREAVGVYQGFGSGEGMSGAQLALEQLGEVRHQVLIMPERGSVEGEIVVPDGHYFVLGDNRDNSNDSRFWGMVPEENLVGRAFMIWMNWDIGVGRSDLDRIGMRIE